ncbi:hypothetical protein DSM106972_038620 [Dulcicalothrix desertica PCC 7102]|uniref:Uncharacterized protein n=2 Tax=Dulcicalothrix desertica TaxID=32056 RepID=A0A3S1B551_9CYAN|nr:hypothetical protein DSM106972_038620 [Dulcicalothrix desertica PCC 7102]
MVSETYKPPVDKLLTYADCSKLKELPNYIEEFGFGKEHIPDLIRLATDKNLYETHFDSLEVWAPVHAWRALGQLRAKEAIEPLITLFHDIEDDWTNFDLPKSFGLIGEPAIPALTEYINDDSREDYQRFAATSCFFYIAVNYPKLRKICVSILTRKLELYKVNEKEFNAILVEELIKLKAVESASIIKKAFSARKVDTLLMGNWDDAQVGLGLKTWEEIYCTDGYELSPFDAMLKYSAPELYPFPNASSKKKRKKKKGASSR